MPSLPDSLNTNDHALWLTIALCIATIFTIEAVEEAVEGAWPHQRRPTRMVMSERRAQPIWAVVAILILPGAALAILTLSTMAWQDLPRTDALVYGGILLGVAWLIFLLAGVDRLRVRRAFASIGPVAPVALVIMLIVADGLLLIAFTDIRPSIQSVRDALPSLRS